MEEPNLPVIGWREWVSLPELGLRRVKAKVDSGAASSSLHAFDIETFDREGQTWVRFLVHPTQHDDSKAVTIEAKVLENRSVRSSSGKASVRPVIETQITMMGQTWPIELTLANRKKMKFRMLLGRQAFRGRFAIDVDKSFCGGRPKVKKSSRPN